MSFKNLDTSGSEMSRFVVAVKVEEHEHMRNHMELSSQQQEGDLMQ